MEYALGLVFVFLIGFVSVSLGIWLGEWLMGR